VYSHAVSLSRVVCAAALTTCLAVLTLACEAQAEALADEGAVAALDEAALDEVAAFDGDYVFAGGQQEREAIHSAIETSLEAVNPVIRVLARKRLREANTAPRGVSIQVDESEIEVSMDGHGHRAILNGSPAKGTSQHGGKVKVSYRFRDGRLTEFTDGVGGNRHNYMTLSPSGDKLTIKVKMSSSQLPVPVEYRLTFKRK